MARLSADPYPILADLREHEPVSWVPETEMWFVTRYDDVRAVLADFETYTVDTEHSIIRDMFGRHMMTLDGPEQVRHKKQCMPMFRPRDLAASVGSSVDERVTRLVDEFAGGGGGPGKEELGGGGSGRAMGAGGGGGERQSGRFTLAVSSAPGGRDGRSDPRAAAGAGASHRSVVRPIRRSARKLRP